MNPSLVRKKLDALALTEAEYRTLFLIFGVSLATDEAGGLNVAMAEALAEVSRRGNMAQFGELLEYLAIPNEESPANEEIFVDISDLSDDLSSNPQSLRDVASDFAAAAEALPRNLLVPVRLPDNLYVDMVPKHLFKRFQDNEQDRSRDLNWLYLFLGVLLGFAGNVILVPRDNWSVETKTLSLAFAVSFLFLSVVSYLNQRRSDIKVKQAETEIESLYLP